MANNFEKLTKTDIERIIKLMNYQSDNYYIVLKEFETHNGNCTKIAQYYQGSIYIKVVYQNNINPVFNYDLMLGTHQ